MTLPPKVCLAISPNILTIPIHCRALGTRLLELTPMTRFHTSHHFKIHVCYLLKLHVCRRITLYAGLILRPQCLPEIEATCVSDKSLCAADNQTPYVPEINAPCVSGNQASFMPGSAHLPISESLPRKSASTVS